MSRLPVALNIYGDASRPNARRRRVVQPWPGGVLTRNSLNCYAQLEKRSKRRLAKRMEPAEMTRNNWVLATVCGLIVLLFAYSFWIGAQKSPAIGGPAPIAD
jgi:hypothetical protein